MSVMSEEGGTTKVFGLIRYRTHELGIINQVQK
jgi:hypothetical protein